jgi:paraquat-inducible protein B
MSKEPRYALIGLFVVGACSIVVIALLFLGSGNLFRQTKTFVAYFSGSVKGLMVGAPVNFRGARVGSVKDVDVVYDSVKDQLMIPVTFEVDPDAVKGLSLVAGKPEDGESAPLMKRLVEHGLRAQLSLESLVTGQLYVSLDFFPDTPVQYRADSTLHPEVPTVESSLDKIKGKIEDLPVNEIAQQLQRVLGSLDALLGSDEVKGTIIDLRALVPELTNAIKNFDSRSSVLLGDVEKFRLSADKTLSQAQESLRALETIFKSNSPMMQDTAGMIREISAAARSLRQFAEYLQNNPETLLRGKR